MKDGLQEIIFSKLYRNIQLKIKEPRNNTKTSFRTDIPLDIVFLTNNVSRYSCYSVKNVFVQRFRFSYRLMWSLQKHEEKFRLQEDQRKSRFNL